MELKLKISCLFIVSTVVLPLNIMSALLGKVPKKIGVKRRFFWELCQADSCTRPRASEDRPAKTPRPNTDKTRFADRPARWNLATSPPHSLLGCSGVI